MIIDLFFIFIPFIYGLIILGLSIRKPELLLVFVNYILFGKISSKYEKILFKSIFGKNSKIVKRPNPLGKEIFKGKYDKCTIPINKLKPWKLKLVDKDYFKDDKNNPSFGFPSGHAQESSFIATFFTLYCLNKDIKYKYIYIIVLWIINILTIHQRVRIGCHTILQVIVGDLFGIILGSLSYYICHLILPKKFPFNLNTVFHNQNI